MARITLKSAVLLLVASPVFAGLQLTQTSAEPGTTITLGVQIVNDDPTNVSWNLNTVAPVTFSLSVVGEHLGDAPSFSGSGLPVAGDNWTDIGLNRDIFPFPSGTFIRSSSVDLGPGDAEQFASIGVVVPDDFAGTFRLAVMDAVEIVSAQGSGVVLDSLGPAGQRGSFDVAVNSAAVPEPSAFLFLGLIGCVFAIRRARRK